MTWRSELIKNPHTGAACSVTWNQFICVVSVTSIS